MIARRVYVAAVCRLEERADLVRALIRDELRRDQSSTRAAEKFEYLQRLITTGGLIKARYQREKKGGRA